MKRSLLICALLAVACGGSGSVGGGPDGNFQGTDGGDAGPCSAATVIEANDGAGLDLVATVDPSGKPAVAYFRHDPNVNDPTCNADAGCPAYALIVARETSPGTWTTEQVPASIDGGELTGHFGVSLAFDPSGEPAVSYMGGNTSHNDPHFPDDRWTDFLTGARLPSDLVVARKSGTTWTRTTLATSSDSIATDFATTSSHVDDNGPVTGLWSGIAFDSGGTLHALTRDVHYGSAAADFDASNLEYAEFSGATMNIGEIVTSRIYPLSPVSQQVHGGGTYTHFMLVGGQPVVSFALGLQQPNDSSQVWFAKRTAANTWTRTMVSNVSGRTGMGPSLAVSSTQGFALGFIDGTQADLQVSTSSDGVTWTQPNTVEALGETGYHPAVAWSGATLGVLYGYCHDPVYSGTSPCDPLTQQLRFRMPVSNPNGAWLTPETVDGVIPDQTALVVDGSGNYVAIWRDATGGVKAARRSSP
jgi:hypothetical protein